MFVTETLRMLKRLRDRSSLSSFTQKASAGNSKHVRNPKVFIPRKCDIGPSVSVLMYSTLLCFLLQDREFAGTHIQVLCDEADGHGKWVKALLISYVRKNIFKIRFATVSSSRQARTSVLTCDESCDRCTTTKNLD